METRHCSYLRVFWVRLTEVGRPTLNVAGPIPWAEVLDFLCFFFFFQMQCDQLPQALVTMTSLS